jgi:hypothetical protein
LQNGGSSALDLIKSIQIFLYIINPLAITNLILINCGLPPQAYEFIRVIGSMIFKKIPSWNEIQYSDLYKQEYQPIPFFQQNVLDESYYPNQRPEGKIFEFMGFSRNFFINSFIPAASILFFWIVFSIFEFLF